MVQHRNIDIRDEPTPFPNYDILGNLKTASEQYPRLRTYFATEIVPNWPQILNDDFDAISLPASIT